MPDRPHREMSVYRDLHLFDEAQFGVVRTDLSGYVAYSNRWMNTLVGRDLGNDSCLFDLVVDADSCRTLAEELQKRKDGRSGEYTLIIDTPLRSVKIRVFATPLRAENDAVVGSVVFVTRAPLDALREAMLKIALSPDSPLSALSRLHELLDPMYPFDGFVVSMYDAHMEYARVLYTYMRDVPAASMRWNKHWIRLTPAQREWIEALSRLDVVIEDLSEFLAREEWRSLANDSMTLAMQSAGIQSTAGLLVTEGSTIVASVSLLSKRRGAYNQDVVRELHELPIDGVVLAVINALRDNDTAFRHELLRRLARSQNIDELTDLVVRQVQRHYRFSRVHLYSINWVDNEARLSAVSVGGRLKRYAPATSASLTDGVVAEVARSAAPKYICDVSKVQDCSHLLVLEHGSAFCWPVRYQGGSGPVRWVFIAADQNQDAFSPAEQATLIDIGAHIGGLLERLTELHFLRSTFDATSDAILVVDGRNEVRRANRAAAQLFGVERPRDLVGDISKFFDEPAEAQALLRRCDATAELDIVNAAKVSIPTLVNSRTLPDSVGGKVIAFEDLRTLQRLEELTFLGRVGSAISVQAQTPLTLASSWVERLRISLADLAIDSAANTDLMLDLTERTLLQLRRIQSCLDRVALYDANGKLEARPARPVSLGDELRRAAHALPVVEQRLLRLRIPDDKIIVRIYPEHLHFVLDSMVSFFLRELPDADRLELAAGRHDGCGWIQCRVSNDRAMVMETRVQNRTSLVAELGLVERGLQQILAAYAGAFTCVRSATGLTSARVQIPLYRSA